jgi:hypothetical protein
VECRSLSRVLPAINVAWKKDGRGGRSNKLEVVRQHDSTSDANKKNAAACLGVASSGWGIETCNDNIMILHTTQHA